MDPRAVDCDILVEQSKTLGSEALINSTCVARLYLGGPIRHIAIVVVKALRDVVQLEAIRSH